MTDFKSICILGRQPAFGLAELESLYGGDHIESIGGAALLDIAAEDINFKRLGGTIKVAKLLAEIEGTSWDGIVDYLVKTIPEHLKYLPDGKLTLGISAYGLKANTSQINKSALQIKKIIKQTGRPVRIVPNKEPALNSAQVLHNKLTHRGAWELILIKNGSNTLLAQTLFVQDIEAYAARDQARPARDARVGMLPPKLAQVLVNLAAGQIDKSAPEKARVRILDPFCGTGVILQEALLMGYSVFGTDLEERLVEYSTKNLQWLYQKYPELEGGVVVEQADATNHSWPGFSAIASEIYLGRPLTSLPQEAKLREIITDTDTIFKKFMQNLLPQLLPNRRVVVAVPAWRRPSGTLIRLPTIAKLTDMGYAYVDLKNVRGDELVYFRENQVVARQLLVLRKK